MRTCPAPDGSLLPFRHRHFFSESLRLMAANGFREGLMRAQLPALAQGFANLTPSDEDLLAWHAELQVWVRWYRVPAYWLCAVFQNGTVRLGSMHAALSSCLFAQSQILFADDLALSSLETAYVGISRNQAAFGSDFDRVRLPVEHLLSEYRAHLAQWAVPFEYRRCNPFSDHPYSRLTANWLAEDLAEEKIRPEFDNEHWWREFIERVDHDQLTWHRVVARRFLGLRLAARGDNGGRLAQFSAALDLAREHRLDTEIGQLNRLVGQSLRDLGKLDGAIQAFERAVAFEGAAQGKEYATYWQALSLRGLGDTLMRRASRAAGTMAISGGAGHADLLQALQVYRAGRKNFGMHLSIQCPQPLARTAKHQMQRSFSENALVAAAMAQSPSDLLAEMEESGPREATGMIIEMLAPQTSSAEDRASFRRHRARYFATLNTTPPPLADYLADVIANPLERREYQKHYIDSARHLAQSQPGDAVAQRLMDLQLPDTLFLLFHLGATSGTLLFVDLGDASVVRLPLAFGEHQVREWHAEHRREWDSAREAPEKCEALRRHRARYEQALAAVIDPLLRFLPGRYVKIFPRLHMNAVPFHALEFQGKPLLLHAETVSYGQTLALFLANHDARSLSRKLPNALRIVIGSDLPWCQLILPDLRRCYDGAMDEHIQVAWPALLAAIEQRPARDTVFACHGHFDATRVTRSEMDLGSAGVDGQVSFDRVFEQLDLHGCRSVIMGSCESGVARTEVAAEYLGLPTAMLASGVRYVVGALWTIPELATAIAMERLLVALRDDAVSVAAALSSVQRELLAFDQEQAYAWVLERLPGHPQLPKLLADIGDLGERPFADPYHWAGLQTLGDI